jgi:hypothetical protein
MIENSREIQELLEHRDDDGEWEEEAEPVTVKTGSEVVSFRLSSDELDALAESAEQRGESLSEYIRAAIALRLHGTPIGPAVEVSSGATRLTIRSHIVVGGSRVAEGSFVPDVPPMTAAAI